MCINIARCFIVIRGINLMFCSLIMALKDFPKYMNRFGFITTLPLRRGIGVLEIGMVGTRSIIFYVVVRVSSKSLKSTSLLALLLFIYSSSKTSTFINKHILVNLTIKVITSNSFWIPNKLINF